MTITIAIYTRAGVQILANLDTDEAARLVNRWSEARARDSQETIALYYSDPADDSQLLTYILLTEIAGIQYPIEEDTPHAPS